MTRKLVSLPLVPSVVDDALAARRGPPTIDEARQRLGGRAASTRPVGGAVRVRAQDGTERPAVVVFANDLETCLWLGDGVIRCVRLDEPLAPADDVPPELAAIAADARVFASLSEGHPVRYQVPGHTMEDGILAEKCRFGALVTTSTGRTMVVVFRLLWPIANSPS